MHDPRLPQLFELWFMTFGSAGQKVQDLLKGSPPPLLELFLRYAPDPADRHAAAVLGSSGWSGKQPRARLLRRGQKREQRPEA
jgi:hypothetical protein